MVKIKIVVSLLVILTLSWGYSPSLKALLEKAKHQNPDILAARKAYQVALVNIGAQGSWDSPMLGWVVDNIPAGSLDLSQTMVADRKLLFSQTIPLGNKLMLQSDIASYEAKMRRLDLVMTEQRIQSNVIHAYYTYWDLAQDIRLSHEQLDLLDRIRKILLSQYSVGTTEYDNLVGVQVEVAELTVMIRNLTLERDIKQARVNLLLNQAEQTPIKWSDFTMTDLAVSADDSVLHPHNPSFQQASLAVSRQKAEQSLSESKYWPDLSTQIALGGLGSSQFVTGWGLMMSVNLPVWFWGRQTQEVDASIQMTQRMDWLYQSQLNQLKEQILETSNRLQMARNNILLYQTEIIPLLQRAIDSSLSRLQTGKANTVSLLMSVRRLLDAKKKLYSSMADGYRAWAELQAIQGTL